jgi:putative peptidoglycan lipid II flippase
MQKFFSHTTQTITGAAILLGAASFLSRLIGLLRDRLFASLFGAGPLLDTYYAAFRIPDFVYNIIIIGALSAGLIPLFAKTMAKSKTETWETVNVLMSIVGTVTFFIGIIFFIFAPNVIRFLVPGFSEAMQHETITLTRIMFLSPVILGLSSIVSSVLQTYKNFFIYSLSPILYNLGIIFGALVFVPMFGTRGLAYGVVLGAILHLGVQLPTLFGHGWRFRPIFAWKHPAVRMLRRTMIPRMLDLAVGDINLMVIIAMASTLGAGQITAFQFANNLQTFPVGLIGVSFAVATFPALASLAVVGKREELRLRVASTIKQILFFIIPLTIILLLLRAQIVRVVLGGGAFDWTATVNTANVLGFFALSLFAQALLPLLVRAFFALEDTWTPFFTSLVSMVVNVALGFFLKNKLGVAGLGLAFSGAMIVECSLLWVLLRQKLGSLHDLIIVQTAYKISIAGFAMALTIQLLKNPIAHLVNMTKFWGIFAQGAICGLAGLSVYIIITYILKTEELLELKKSLTRRWLNSKYIETEIPKTETP